MSVRGYVWRGGGSLRKCQLFDNDEEAAFAASLTSSFDSVADMYGNTDRRCSNAVFAVFERWQEIEV